MDITLALLILVGLIVVIATNIASVSFMQKKMDQKFHASANTALINNQQHFLDLTNTTLNTTLKRFQSEAKGDLEKLTDRTKGDLEHTVSSLSKQIERLENQSTEQNKDYGAISQKLQSVAAGQDQLYKALGSPHTRGIWGEMHLKRTLELAGLAEHYDFRTQTSLPGRDSRPIRPDVIIHLPGQRMVIIDAKVPWEAYRQAMDAKEEDKREQLLNTHADHLNQHIKELASKAYWDALEESPEFVYLYLPIEALLSEALSRKPNLHEESMQKKVLVVTPTTLMASLTIIAHEWRQDKLIQNYREIANLSKVMYERLLKLTDHFSKIGTSLTQSVKAYNITLGSFEERVIVQAKRLTDLGIPGKKDMIELDQVDIPREPKDKYLKEHTKNEDLPSRPVN